MGNMLSSYYDDYCMYFKVFTIWDRHQFSRFYLDVCNRMLGVCVSTCLCIWGDMGMIGQRIVFTARSLSG